MSKYITLAVPSRDKKTGKVGSIETRGQVSWLYIGEHKHKCFVQTDGVLSDFASGYSFGSWKGEYGYLMATYGTGRRYTPRQCSQSLLDRHVARHGADKVLKTVSKAPQRESN